LSAALVPLRGTLYDARGQVVVDPRVDRARAFFGAMPGGYTGARSDHRALQEWTPIPKSGDADSIGDLPALRARSRDLCRNAGFAGGAVATVVTNAIGTGLTPQPSVDSDYLSEQFGITEEAADAFERAAARLWRYHSEGRFFDVAGIETHQQLQSKVLRSVLESGDMVGLRRVKKNRPGALFTHCVQLIEADLISNPPTVMDREGFAAGVETDADGEQIAFHVASRHEFDLGSWEPVVWKRIPARGKVTGERLVRHIAWRRRAKQSRGVPYLAGVIVQLKQLARYGDAELMAAVVASMFTVFVKSEYGGDPFQTETAVPGSVPTVGENLPLPKIRRLGTGAIVDLLPGEDISIAKMERPNGQYDPFVQSILREIGAQLEIPFELLIKHFTASYSAARASRLEFWKFLAVVRSFIASDFCQPDYEDLVTEAVALGYLDAPGFFEDPIARQAWLGCRWTGPAPGQIDEESEVQASILKINNGLSTLEEETAALTGGNWERNHRQQVKERRAREAAGLTMEPIAGRIRTEPQQPEGEDTPDERVDGDDTDEQKANARVKGKSRRRRTRAEMLDALDEMHDEVMGVGANG
jgi:lambda family phage portal protein